MMEFALFVPFLHSNGCQGQILPYNFDQPVSEEDGEGRVPLPTSSSNLVRLTLNPIGFEEGGAEIDCTGFDPVFIRECEMRPTLKRITWICRWRK